MFASAGRLDSRVTFTRSSTATYVNQIGLIQSAAVNEPRFDYDPVTLAARGLLIEESRTNLLTYSEDFSNGAWIKSGSAISSNAATSPDGTVNADSFSTGGTIYQQVSYASNVAITLSVFAKGSGTFRVDMSDNTTGDVYCDFNLSTGVAGSVTTGGVWAGATASIIQMQNGWYRCILTATKNAGTAINAVFVGVTGQSIWGAQCE
jgi:hypothetical protein